MRLAASLTLGIGLTLGPQAWAAPCFCLVEQDRTTHFDCVEEGFRGEAKARTVECHLKPDERRREIKEIKESHTMKQVPAGEPPCDLCDVVTGDPVRRVRTGNDTLAAGLGNSHD